MNFKKTVKILENFFEEELTNKPPITILSDKSIIYNNFIIKKNSKELWELKRPGGNVLDTFNLKTTAISAAKLYHNNNFKNYNYIKILDETYSKNTIDAELYKTKYKKTTDIELKDLFIARYTDASHKASYAKKQIINQFKTLF